MHSDLEEHFIALSFSQGSLSSKYFESFQMHIKIQPFAIFSKKNVVILLSQLYLNSGT